MNYYYYFLIAAATALVLGGIIAILGWHFRRLNNELNENQSTLRARTLAYEEIIRSLRMGGKVINLNATYCLISRKKGMDMVLVNLKTGAIRAATDDQFKDFLIQNGCGNADELAEKMNLDWFFEIKSGKLVKHLRNPDAETPPFDFQMPNW